MRKHTPLLMGWLTMMLGVATLTSTTFAQRTIIMQNDDGGGPPKVLHMSMPNLGDLRTPDFTRRDLPLFTDKLVLSAEQTEVIGRLIDAYLEQFRELTRSLVELAGPEAEFDPAAADEAADNRTGARKLAAALGGPGGGNQFNLDEVENLIPPGTSIGISVGMGAPIGRAGEGEVEGDAGGEGAPPMPHASVDVTLDPPEGEEIPQEVLDKIQQKAREFATQLEEQMFVRMNGEEPEGDAAAIKGILPDEMDIEQMQEKMARMQEAFDQFVKAKAALRATFVTDAQTSLTEDQVARWPALERALTRKRSLPRGEFAGENVDLLQILAGMGLTEREMESIASPVESYELALDAALKQRDAHLDGANREIDEAIAQQKMDRAVQIVDRLSDLRVAVRNVNQSHALQIAEALGGERGKEFAAAVQKACYPRVYQTTRGQKMFAAAKAIEGLDDATRQSLHDLEQAYEAELANVNEQIRGVLDREEPQRQRHSYEQLRATVEGRGGNGPGPDLAAERESDPIRQAMSRRAALDDRYLDLVQKVLPPALAASLPKPRQHKGPIVISSSDAS